MDTAESALHRAEACVTVPICPSGTFPVACCEVAAWVLEFVGGTVTTTVLCQGDRCD
jgi:hypothetical protein